MHVICAVLQASRYSELLQRRNDNNNNNNNINNNNVASLHPSLLGEFWFVLFPAVVMHGIVVGGGYYYFIIIIVVIYLSVGSFDFSLFAMGAAE